MKCPDCQRRLRVLETRLVPEGVRRRRFCHHCQTSFATLEQLVRPSEHGEGRLASALADQIRLQMLDEFSERLTTMLVSLEDRAYTIQQRKKPTGTNQEL